MTLCPPNDPNRCHKMNHDGQCKQLSLPGTNFCEKHYTGKWSDGQSERYMIDNQSLRDSYKRQKGDKQYLNLKEEILLIQALIEQRLQSIQTSSDLTLAVGPINMLVGRLESMKVALLKMQQQLGLVIDKDSLRQLARDIALILDEELEGLENKEVLLDRISIKIVESIEDAGKKEDE